MKLLAKALFAMALIAGSAQAGQYDTDINGDLTVETTVTDSIAVGIGDGVEVDQGSIRMCGTRVNGDAELTATVDDSIAVGIGKDVRVAQGSILIGDC